MKNLNKKGLIRDPHEKLKMLYRIVGTQGDTPIELSRKLLGIEISGLKGELLDPRVKSLSENIKGYFALSGKRQVTISATKGQYFLSLIADYLSQHGCELSEYQIPDFFVQSTAEEFEYNLPPKLKDPFKDSLIMKPNHLISEFNNLHKMWFSIDSPKETAKDILRTKGRIDQKFFYLSPDSEEIWLSVIGNGGYKQFDECKWTMEHMLTSNKHRKIWCEFFMEGGADSIVMLGGGSVPKDMILIREALKLLPPGVILNYTIVDYSNYMLKTTYKKIFKHLIEEDLTSRVKLHILEHDFLKFKEIKDFRPTGKKTAWFIPGGTIGNVEEGKFLDSVKSEARTGDFLVIGAETVVEGDQETFRTSMNKYRSPEVKRFLAAPLRSIWHEIYCNDNNHTVYKNLKGIETIDKALNRIDIDMVSGQENAYSEVPDSVTVELSLKVNDEKIVLFTSSRYIEESFTKFVVQKNLKHLTNVESLLNDRYKYFVFCFDEL